MSSGSNALPEIRPYRPADRERLLDFLQRTFTEMGRRFVLEGKDADIRDIETVYLGPRACFCVVEGLGSIGGCAALRQFSGEIGELKRLYLAREYRQRGLGRALCERIIDDARQRGYRLIRLDTMVSSTDALTLFRKLGFHEIERYNDLTFPDMVFMEKAL